MSSSGTPRRNATAGPSPVKLSALLRDLVHAPEAAGGEEHRLRVEDVEVAAGEAHRDHAAADAVAHEQVEQEVLVEERHAVLDALLVERLEDAVPGVVGGVAGALDGGLAEVARVPAEPPLRDPAVGRAVERQAPVLEPVNRLDRVARQDLGRVLVGEVVAALDRVEHVPEPVVRLLVPERGADAALRRAGVRADRDELADDGGADVRGELQRRHQPRAAGPDHDHVRLVRLLVVERGHPPSSLGRRNVRIVNRPSPGK